MTTTTNAPIDRVPKRVALFGMECGFTASFMEPLRATGTADTVAIVLARTETAAPSADPPWLRQFRSLDSSTILELTRKGELTSHGFLSEIEALDVEVIVVACFPWRIPAVVLALPSIASVNVHPSLLPDGRGPEPIFWAFRRGLATTGVTLHAIDDGLDTGPIIDQRALSIPAGATMITLERSLARLGADTVSEFLSAPSHAIKLRPQPIDAVHPAPFPEAADLIVTTSWEATTAARFINGVSPIYGSIEVLVLTTGQRLAVTEVLEIEKYPSAKTALRQKKGEAWIQFADGILHCRIRLTHQHLSFEI